MRIIVLVDFSLYTDSLIKIASKWADLFIAELILIHEVPRMIPTLIDDNTRFKIIEAEKEEAISRLKSLAEMKIPPRISTRFEVTNKHLKYFLPQLISNDKTNLIMLGLKGTGLLKQIFIGSVATEIINEINNEINKITIGVPLRAKQGTPDNLIIPVNPDYPINEEQLNQLLTFLRPTLNHIDFVSINQSGEADRETKNYLKDLSTKYNGSISTSHKVFNSQNVFEEFKLFATQKENCYLVLQQAGHSFKDQILKHFFINRVVHDGTIPLIVLPK